MSLCAFVPWWLNPSFVDDANLPGYTLSMRVSNNEFVALLDELHRIAVDAGQSFGTLTVEQLNWKPSAEQWSVGQCFDHLMTANRSYYPAINGALEGRSQKTFWERLPVLPGLFGKLLIKSLQPDSGRKLKAPVVFRPASSQIGGDVIGDFVAHQKELSEMMKRSARLDLERTIIISPAVSFITYSLMDAYRIIVVHEKRHFLQAQRILDAPGFPLS